MKLKINFKEAFNFYIYTIEEAKELFNKKETEIPAYSILKERYTKLRKFCQRSFPKDKIRGFHYSLNKFNFNTGEIKYEKQDLENKTKRGYFYV
jgi:hypothetical protein